MKAIDQMERINLRRRRSQSLVAAVLRKMDARRVFVDWRLRRNLADALGEVFAEEGVEVVTDYHRAQCGLPPRGPDGWTLEEIAALERYRLEALLKPLQVTVPTFDDIRGQSVDLSGIKPKKAGNKD